PARSRPAGWRPLWRWAPRAGRLVILAAGRPAGSMTEVAERHSLDGGVPPARIHGVAVTRHGYGRPTQVVPVVEAGHPVPDEAGLAAAGRTPALAGAPAAGALLVRLLSRRASAHLVAPAPRLGPFAKP